VGFAAVLLTPLVAACIGCGPTRPQDDKRFRDAAEALRASPTLTLLEGLPHPRFERDLLEAEKRRARFVTRHGWPFYEQPLPLSEADIRTLRETCANPANYSLRDPEQLKLCGGFHPDYALVWPCTGGECELQICFGCTEADLHTPSYTVLLEFDDVVISPPLRSRRGQRPEPPR